MYLNLRYASNLNVRMPLEELIIRSCTLGLWRTSKTLPRKPGNIPHSTRLTRGILRIPLLIKKHSGMVTTTAMPHLSSGYSATTEKA